eukprot:CAMPEP_0204360832 /NCGR_PEP_ID=MMETSP0469-20131031/38344_1 /ASSEMBLY_ACC=CAM_ASM_000384 /TAXON_ID=2969 /ORGANISM="Oxyrrhis marina" /LENGTH=196 /DNA_ID=CAMNT_0051349125 /DNA_START=36 /DNA_END=623 /DNA_ORIENTATION=+
MKWLVGLLVAAEEPTMTMQQWKDENTVVSCMGKESEFQEEWKDGSSIYGTIAFSRMKGFQVYSSNQYCTWTLDWGYTDFEVVGQLEIGLGLGIGDCVFLQRSSSSGVEVYARVCGGGPEPRAPLDVVFEPPISLVFVSDGDYDGSGFIFAYSATIANSSFMSRNLDVVTIVACSTVGCVVALLVLQIRSHLTGILL